MAQKSGQFVTMALRLDLPVCAVAGVHGNQIQAAQNQAVPMESRNERCDRSHLDLEIQSHQLCCQRQEHQQIMLPRHRTGDLGRLREKVSKCTWYYF